MGAAPPAKGLEPALRPLLQSLRTSVLDKPIVRLSSCFRFPEDPGSGSQASVLNYSLPFPFL